MRKLLFLLLTLAMFMPSLACAMPCCPLAARAAQVPPPCHATLSTHKAPPAHMRLMADCQGLDLHKADPAQFENALSATFDAGDFIADSGFLFSTCVPRRPTAIRVAPPDWPDISEISMPVLFRTLRLRH